MKATFLAVSVGILIAGCAGDRHSGSGASGSGSASLSGNASGSPAPEEASFAREACHTGVAEAEIGKLASRNTKNEAVRSLAKRLVKDHTEAEKELAAIFVRKGMRAEPELAEHFKSSINHLAGLKGAAFDQAFKEQVISDHEKAIRSSEQQATQGADPDLKAFAEKRLPQLRAHLVMAQQLNVANGQAEKESESDAGALHKAIKGTSL